MRLVDEDKNEQQRQRKPVLLYKFSPPMHASHPSWHDAMPLSPGISSTMPVFGEAEPKRTRRPGRNTRDRRRAEQPPRPPRCPAIRGCSAGKLRGSAAAQPPTPPDCHAPRYVSTEARRANDGCQGPRGRSPVDQTGGSSGRTSRHVQSQRPGPAQGGDETTRAPTRRR